MTRVPRRYLDALEADDFAALPTAVFARGYIRAYCQAVGEPPDEALQQYAAATVPAGEPGKPAAPTPLIAPSDVETRSRGPVLVSFVLLVVLGLALFGLTLTLQSGRDSGERRPESGTMTSDAGDRDAAGPASTPSQEPSGGTTAVASAPAPSVAPPSPPPDTSASVRPPTPAPGAPTPAPAAAPRSVPPTAERAPDAPHVPPPAAARPPADAVRPATPATPHPATAERVRPVAPEAPGSAAPEASADTVPAPPIELGPVTAPYRLIARAREATWLRVRTQDGSTSEETIPAGGVREWASDRPFLVTVGNAGGVVLELNGHRLPLLGASGAVVRGLVLPPSGQ